MSTLAAILAGVAARVGAPIVKELLERHVGGTGAAIGGAVIDAIAGKAGVAPEALPTLPPDQLDAAVRAVEGETPELVAAWSRQQELAHELMRAEMEKSESFWTWGWRPGGMWLIGFFWLLYVFVYPLLNLFLRLFGTSAVLVTIVDVATLLAISGGFLSLYMGGNTVLRGIEKWKGTQ